MNISFFDGVNDGKFYSINAGKYDELGEEDIDISEEIEEEDDTCLNRFEALEKDTSKLRMDLNNLRNEFKGQLVRIRDLNGTFAVPETVLIQPFSKTCHRLRSGIKTDMRFLGCKVNDVMPVPPGRHRP